MIRPALIALAATALAACAPTTDPHRPSKENRSLAEQLEPNWNVPTPLTCHRVVSARITMASDGTVTGVEPVEPIPVGDPCRVIVDSLRRAALLSSPLWYPPGQTPPSTVVRFDPENFKAYY